MRHRIAGRTLGRNASHRKAMFRNMAVSLIHTVRIDEDDDQKPKVSGRITTTVAKAKEIRSFIEKLITLARGSLVHAEKASKLASPAARNTSEWKSWRESDKYPQWKSAVAPVVNLRRRAFAQLRDKLAVEILFDEIAKKFEGRDGGYTRVVRLAGYRLGDAGQKAIIEFVGKNDRTKKTRKPRQAPAVAESEGAAPAAAPATETTTETK
jgi:large subunit ribosomal protein L17